MEDKGDYFEYAGTRIDKKRILELPPQAVTYVSQVFLDLGNKTDDLNKFQFRSSLVSLIPMWILLYGFIFSLGIIMNCKLIHWIRSIHRMKTCTAHAFLMHLLLGNSLNDLLVKDVIVMPVSFSTMTGVHWILGRNVCKFFPIVQDSCFYSSSLILLCAFVMRFRHISHSSFHSGTRVIEFQKSIKSHSSIAVLLICFGIALCAIIPHTVYIEFVDLGYYFGQPFAGSGVCFLSQNHIIDYVKYLFIIFYVVPVCLSLSYHFKTTDIIEKWEESSEHFIKTNRLTIHRGSLIETSSFINTDATAAVTSTAGANKSATAASADDGFRGISHHHHVSKPALQGTATAAVLVTSPVSKNIPTEACNRYPGQAGTAALHQVPIIFTSTDCDEEEDRGERLHLHLAPNHYQSFERSPGSSNAEDFKLQRSNSGNRSLRFSSDGRSPQVMGRREMDRMLQHQQQQQSMEKHGIQDSNKIKDHESRVNRIRNHNSSLRIMKGTSPASAAAGSPNMKSVRVQAALGNEDSSAGMDFGYNSEYDENRRRNTINFYPSALESRQQQQQQNVSELRILGSVPLNNPADARGMSSGGSSGSCGNEVTDRYGGDGSRRRESGRRILLQEQNACMPRINHVHQGQEDKCVTSYRSRDPADMIIHCNPVHDMSATPHAAAGSGSGRPSNKRTGRVFQDQDNECEDVLQDVRIDDVIRESKAMRERAKEESEDDDDDDDDDEVGSSDRVLLRTSLEIENMIQKMMSRILLFHSLLLLPVNILRFVKHLVPGWDAELTLDLAFLSFVGLTFCTILIVPAIVMSLCVPAYEDAQERFLRDEDQQMLQRSRKD